MEILPGGEWVLKEAFLRVEVVDTRVDSQWVHPVPERTLLPGFTCRKKISPDFKNTKRKSCCLQCGSFLWPKPHLQWSSSRCPGSLASSVPGTCWTDWQQKPNWVWGCRGRRLRAWRTVCTRDVQPGPACILHASGPPSPAEGRTRRTAACQKNKDKLPVHTIICN